MGKPDDRQAVMILAIWRGFEIDSSEGYYVFAREMDHIDDGWTLLNRLLSSPLVWKTVGFRLGPSPGRERAVQGVLQEWRAKKRIRPGTGDEFTAPVEAISTSDFLSLFLEIRTGTGYRTRSA